MARLTIPLDASGIEGFDPKQPVKVLLTSGGTPIASETITFDKKGVGQVAFDVDPKQTGLRVVVGPPDASDEELTGLQTIGVDVPRRRFGGRDELVIPGDPHHAVLLVLVAAMVPDLHRTRARRLPRRFAGPRRRRLRLRRRRLVVVVEQAAGGVHDDRRFGLVHAHLPLVLRLVAVVVASPASLVRRTQAL